MNERIPIRKVREAPLVRRLGELFACWLVDQADSYSTGGWVQNDWVIA